MVGQGHAPPAYLYVDPRTCDAYHTPIDAIHANLINDTVMGEIEAV